MNKRIVYTALTGGYDGLIQHKYVEASYDYVCFSNDIKESRIGIWEIRRIPFDTDDAQRLSRYPKLQPHEVLKDYEYSLYVDANINILDDTVFRSIEKCIAEGVTLAGMKHQLRQCAYKESLKVMLDGMEKNKHIVKEQMSAYKREGFPFNYGMFEANVIFRKHNDPQVIRQCNDWWYWQQHYSRRDQLSYSYSLWKNKIPFHYLLPENEWARKSPHVDCLRHPENLKFWAKVKRHLYSHQILPIMMALYFPIYKRFVI